MLEHIHQGMIVHFHQKSNLCWFRYVVCSLDESNVVFVEAEWTTHETMKAEYIADRLQKSWHLSVT